MTANTNPTETALAVTPETAVATMEKRWVERIDDLQSRRRGLADGLLQYYYDVGALILQVEADAVRALSERTYGSHTVAHLAVALNESERNVYYARRFAIMMNERRGELALLKEHQVPWRAVTAFLTVKEAGDYEKLRQKFLEGKMTTEDIKEEVKERNEKEREKRKKEGKGTGKGGDHRSVTTVVNGFISSVDLLLAQRGPEFLSTCKTLPKKLEDMSDDSRKGLIELVKEAKKRMRYLGSLAEKATSAIEEAGIK